MKEFLCIYRLHYDWRIFRWGFVNPQAPIAQKIADEVVFRRFQGEEVEFFFKSDLTDPPQIFDACLLKKYQFKPF